MIRTNKDRLPIVSVQGVVWHPKGRSGPGCSVDGEALWLTGVGGITYNAQIGDPCLGWAADHLEPGVSTRHPNDEHNIAYQLRSCIGNEATVLSGDAKGDKGIVTGKHGGCEHLMIWFPQETLEKLATEDKIGVKATGLGMTLPDYPDVLLRNLSPALIEKMNITPDGSRIKVGVAKIVPAAIMGSGLGAVGASTGDYDITLFDEEIKKEYNLGDLRFGDLVGIINADSRFGRSYRTGAVTVGVVTHGDSFTAGHGPGVTTLMSCKTPLIEPFIDPSANLASYFIV
ncbi:MAG: DUF4438 domain-containing protein [Defluviitaleaceae bacterium]|nr:DUF4438 domain-containing protein [Defluviitaleaceae bacterium]MCL2835951.1 DUF4438 domain-containing protein [Defluviitaleaceae bacterium]